MQFLLFLSETMIPILVFSIVGYGIMKKEQVYDDFVQGAYDGFLTVIKILPTLIGLMVGVGILRASGFLDFLTDRLAFFTDLFQFPSQLVPLALVKMFSSSAATGLLLDVFKEYGADSYLGTLASIMMSCTETIFYTMSVYYMSIKITKTRWTLAGALFATFSALVASAFLAGMM